MENDFLWVIDVPVWCDRCRKERVEKIGRMKEPRPVLCACCGVAFDFNADKWKVYIEKCANAAEQVRVAFNTLRQS